ncbi:MAG: DUF2993 domain-containing protein [Gloeomargarita sp. SKYG116]|nr:DUF2993 domain-containing protein [Gloeomargarita sp. SKYG116]MDW8401434.1 DUF2993 domain-containing protein [Gloeomargarita sp. SKYGB_i_bin116]
MPLAIVFTESVPLLANRGLARPLAALLRWWIQQQVTQVENLEVVLGDLAPVWSAGYLPLVQVNARNVIYRDIHLHQVNIRAERIQFHWPFFRKQEDPFVEPITVEIQAVITEQNLNQSLPYLQTFLQPYLQALTGQIGTVQQLQIQNPNLYWLMQDGRQYITQVEVIAPDEIRLTPLAARTQPISISLGSDVQIQTLTMATGAIHLSGQLLIRPAGAPAGSQSNRPGEQ